LGKRRRLKEKGGRGEKRKVTPRKVLPKKKGGRKKNLKEQKIKKKGVVPEPWK